MLGLVRFDQTIPTYAEMLLKPRLNYDESLDVCVRKLIKKNS
jgi:hypothetical protein